MSEIRYSVMYNLQIMYDKRNFKGIQGCQKKKAESNNLLHAQFQAIRGKCTKLSMNSMIYVTGVVVTSIVNGNSAKKKKKKKKKKKSKCAQYVHITAREPTHFQKNPINEPPIYPNVDVRGRTIISIIHMVLSR